MKESSFTFYVEKFNYIETFEDVVIDFMPPILRRRLSTLDKCTVSVLHKAYSEGIQNIVFSSKYGEVDRLNKIISQYTEAGEVSPNTFAGSVHNYPAGFFLLNVQKAIPYTSLASHDLPISSGLLASVISKYDKTLFCYCDVFGEDCKSLALCINKISGNSSNKYRISMNEYKTDTEDFSKYIELFNGRNTILKTPLFNLERLTNAK